MTLTSILIMALAFLQAFNLARANQRHHCINPKLNFLFLGIAYFLGLSLANSIDCLDIIKLNDETIPVILITGLLFMLALPGLGWIETAVWIIILVSKSSTLWWFIGTLSIGVLPVILRLALLYQESNIYQRFFIRQKGSLFIRDYYLGVGATLSRFLMVLMASTAFFYSLRVIELTTLETEIPWYYFSWTILVFIAFGYLTKNRFYKAIDEPITDYLDSIITLLIFPLNILTGVPSVSSLFYNRYTIWNIQKKKDSRIQSTLRIIIPALLSPALIVSIILFPDNHKSTLPIHSESLFVTQPTDYVIIILLFLLFMTGLYFFLFLRNKRSLRQEYMRQLSEQTTNYEHRLEIIYQQLNDQKLEQGRLEDDIRLRNDQLMNMALVIILKNDFISEMREKIKSSRLKSESSQVREELQKVIIMLTEAISMDKERESFYLMVDDVLRDFFIRLQQRFPDLTQNERRLVAFLRLRLSSKEIASLLNITARSVEMNRYRLRKKLGIAPSESITEYIASL